MSSSNTNTKKGSNSATTGSTTTSTRTDGTGTAIALTPVQQKLQRNTQLASKLQSRLPAGTDLTAAAAGFRNLGQFVAAVNVSNNLGLDFTKLKTAMVDDGMSLGQAIQSQRRTVDGNVEASRAQRDADALIRSTEGTGANVTTAGSTTVSGSTVTGSNTTSSTQTSSKTRKPSAKAKTSASPLKAN